MGRFSFESVARGVPRDKLFRWYFDYSQDDVEIIRKRGDASLLARSVRKEGENHVVVENERMVRGKRLKMVYDASMHPESYTCDVRITVPGAYQSDRHYEFSEVPQGTKVTFSDDYRVLSTRMKIADVFGIVRRRLARTSEQGMRAYMAEAEEELSEKKDPGMMDCGQEKKGRDTGVSRNWCASVRPCLRVARIRFYEVA